MMDISKYRDNTDLSDITVEVDGESYMLHKFPLSIASDYFKNHSKTDSKIKIDNFPGGKENFTKIIDHFYGKEVELNIENVAAILDGAEFLEMNGKHNLVDKCEKLIERIFRSTEYSRNIDSLIRLVDSSLDYNNRHEQLKEKALNLICQIWLRPFSSYKSNHKDQFLEDSLIFSSLLELDHTWIIKIIQLNADSENKHYHIGRLAVEYIRSNLLQSNNNDILLNNNIENGSISNDESNDDSNRNASKNKNSNGDENKKSAEIFDDIIESLPDTINIGIHVSVDWLKEAMEFCNEHKCNSKSKLLQICGGMLTHVTAKEVQSMDQKDVKELIDESLKSEKVDSNLMKWIWDHHLLDMAQQDDNLDADLFCKVIKNMPERQPVDPDIIFEIVMAILEKKGDSKKEDLLSTIDLEKISIPNLQKALESKHWDAEIIATAAISRLQKCNEPMKLYGSSDLTNIDLDIERFDRPSYKSSSPSAFRKSWRRTSPSYTRTGVNIDLYSGNDDFISTSPTYYPTYRSNYSPDSYLRLEENLKYELKRITDNYSKYHKDRYGRSRSRKRFNLYSDYHY